MTIKKDQFELNRSQKNLRRDVGRAIVDFNMIEDGDLVMVCISGGKDSYTLLNILQSLQKYAPIKFRIHAVNLDQKQPGFPEHVLPPYSIVKKKIPEGKTYCGLCARLRRGILYNYAESLGADKIALGHHRDDIVETLFLNMFYGGNLSAMPPKLLSEDKSNIVIRPLAYCKELEIDRYAKLMNFPIIPCDLCGSQNHLHRQSIKSMLRQWEKKNPGRIESIFRSITNVSLSQLADVSLFPFRDLHIERELKHRLDVAELV